LDGKLVLVLLTGKSALEAVAPDRAALPGVAFFGGMMMIGRVVPRLLSTSDSAMWLDRFWYGRREKGNVSFLGAGRAPNLPLCSGWAAVLTEARASMR
jgi:hypothetical protein